MASVATMGKDSIAYHTNVAPVARDILEIVERHGEWREAEVRSKIAMAGQANRVASQSPLDDQENGMLLEKSRWLPGKEKVQYWGISCGTALAATLATTYPDRIYRAILDSVVVASDWVPGFWMKSLQDTDKTVALFCNYCYLAGREGYKLWRASPEAIAAAFEQAHLKLWERPIPVPGNSERGPEVVNHNDLKRMFAADAIYHPISGFPLAATLVADLLHGNGSSFADYKASKYKTAFGAYLDNSYSRHSSCQEMGPYSQACQTPNEARDERSPAIWCLKAENINTTKDYFQQYRGILQEQSKLMRDIWAERRLECIGWELRPVWPFAGEQKIREVSRQFILTDNMYRAVDLVNQTSNVDCE
jgi:hypothetical protein